MTSRTIDSIVAGIPRRRRPFSLRSGLDATLARASRSRARARDDREPNQGDLDAAARGLKMTGMSPSDLDALAAEHAGKSMFASKVIAMAAKQMAAAKRRMGAGDRTAALDRILRNIPRARDASDPRANAILERYKSGRLDRVQAVNGLYSIGYVRSEAGALVEGVARETEEDSSVILDRALRGIPDRRRRCSRAVDAVCPKCNGAGRDCADCGGTGVLATDTDAYRDRQGRQWSETEPGVWQCSNAEDVFEGDLLELKTFLGEAHSLADRARSRSVSDRLDRALRGIPRRRARDTK